MTTEPLNPAAIMDARAFIAAWRRSYVRGHAALDTFDRLTAELAAERERVRRVRVLFGDWAEAIPTYIIRAALDGEGAADPKDAD